jgi:hypothetical protein
VIELGYLIKMPENTGGERCRDRGLAAEILDD